VKTLHYQLKHLQLYKLLCQASLIEDLLNDGFDFILTARFQSDPIERRFGQYRQMSGGRFLVSLKDVLYSERIIKIKNLVKESINIIENDIKADETKHSHEFLNEIEDINFEKIILSDESREVAVYIAGYIAKKLVKKFGECCKKFCICSNPSIDSQDTHYLNILSRGGLIVPSSYLIDYVCDGFAYIDCVFDIINSSKLQDRKAAKLVLNIAMKNEAFLCLTHWIKGRDYVHHTISNIYFNNNRKVITDCVHKDNIVAFKKRQRFK
jgi:hypothetical protein